MIGWTSSWWRSIWHEGLRPRSLAASVFAVACVVAATVVRKGLGLISPDSAVFAPYYSATLVAALVGGAEAGALAFGVGGLAAYWLFVPPDWGVASFRLEQLVSLVLYCVFSDHHLGRGKLSRSLAAASERGGDAADDRRADEPTPALSKQDAVFFRKNENTLTGRGRSCCGSGMQVPAAHGSPDPVGVVLCRRLLRDQVA